MYITYATKNFQSGLVIIFKIYLLDGTLHSQHTGIEVGSLGVYYINTNIPANIKRFVVGIVEPDGNWKAYKFYEQ